MVVIAALSMLQLLVLPEGIYSTVRRVSRNAYFSVDRVSSSSLFVIWLQLSINSQ